MDQNGCIKIQRQCAPVSVRSTMEMLAIQIVDKFHLEDGGRPLRVRMPEVPPLITSLEDAPMLALA